MRTQGGFRGSLGSEKWIPRNFQIPRGAGYKIRFFKWSPTFCLIKHKWNPVVTSRTCYIQLWNLVIKFLVSPNLKVSPRLGLWFYLGFPAKRKNRFAKKKNFHDHFASLSHFVRSRKMRKFSLFLRNFALICFAKKCESFAIKKMRKFCKKSKWREIINKT